MGTKVRDRCTLNSTTVPNYVLVIVCLREVLLPLPFSVEETDIKADCPT